MRIRFVSRAAAFVVAGLACAAASGETLYKLIDKNGKVTYSESKPKTFDGEVIRIDIDPNANTATLEKPKPPAPGQRAGNPTPAQQAEEARLGEARQRAYRAGIALQEAKDNPKEGDMMMVGKVGGGVRTIPSEAYQQRLDRLEAAARSAQEELQRAEQGR